MLHWIRARDRLSVFFILACFLCFKCCEHEQDRRKKLIKNWLWIEIYSEIVSKNGEVQDRVCAAIDIIWQQSSNLVQAWKDHKYWTFLGFESFSLRRKLMRRRRKNRNRARCFRKDRLNLWRWGKGEFIGFAFLSLFIRKEGNYNFV